MRVKFRKDHAKKFKKGMVVDDITDQDVKMLADREIVDIVDDKTPLTKTQEHPAKAEPPVKAAPLPTKIETKADHKADIKSTDK